MPDEHSAISPSGSAKFLNCPPSLMLEAQFADESSEAAKEGTYCHSVCQWKLEKYLGIESERPVSEEYDSDEVEAQTDECVSFCIERYEQIKLKDPDAIMLVEQRVDLNNLIPGCFGTCDCLIASKKLATLIIIDFKFGYRPVLASSPQLKCYALGGINLLEPKGYAFKKVTKHIIQPRINNWNTDIETVRSLKTWSTKVLIPKSRLALAGKGKFKCGDWCTWCKANKTCRHRANENLKLAQLDFKKPELLTEEELAEILVKVPAFRDWIDDLWEYATQEALNGKHFEGLKLVEATSRRKYTNEAAVAETCKAHGYQDIFKKVLLTVTEMEKYMGKAAFAEILGDLVEKPQGKPTLVLDSDKRPEMNIAKIDFKENK